MTKLEALELAEYSLRLAIHDIQNSKPELAVEYAHAIAKIADMQNSIKDQRINRKLKNESRDDSWKITRELCS